MDKEEILQLVKDYLSSVSFFNHVHNAIDFPLIDKTANSLTGGKVACFWPVGGYQVGPGATSYLNAGSVQTTTETAAQIQVPVAGTIQNFYCTTYASQPNTGSLVLTFRKNAASQTLAITIPSNASAGYFSDTANSFTVAAGDKICVQATNNAGSNAANITALSFQLTPS